MEEKHLLHLQPTIRMIAQEMETAGIFCRTEGRTDGTQFRNVQLFVPGGKLRSDVLYMLMPGDASVFPRDEYAYVCVVDTPGKAAHIICLDQDHRTVMEFLVELYSRARELEDQLNELVCFNGDLDELCELGASVLDNPVCIHDDWFIFMAMSRELPAVMPPEHIQSSIREFVPRSIVEDFKFDNDYQETYSYRNAQLWDASPSAARCLYVNLWEGSVYRGRLLVVEHHRDFREWDYLLAEALTQRAMMLLKKKQPGGDQSYRSMDHLVYGLLQGNTADVQERNRFLTMMGWNKNDRMVCIRIKKQQHESAPVLDHVLHSDLFREFPDTYIMFTNDEQCIIMNVGQEAMNFGRLRHRLAPLCRDYCLYAGVSSPVNGVRELHLAYYQAEVALNQAFQLCSDHWIMPFAHCALDYLLDNIPTPLQSHHIAAPELLMLLNYDKENDTRYFDTLRTYLLLERDIPRTSEALIIHRTTLLYRLKKIHALVDLDLENPQIRLYLLLSLRILEREHMIPEFVQ